MVLKKQNLSKFERLERASKLHYIHWLIIIGSLLLTLVAWQFTQGQADDKILNQFNREAENVVGLIEERMHKYEDALWSGVAAINSQSHGIDHDEWQRFADTLKIETRYPGINGIGVILPVARDIEEEFLTQQRTTRPNFKIHPHHNQKELLPIVYIEPEEINLSAVGLDMAHEKNRYDAAIKARKTGLPQITGPITLVQDNNKTPGFLFYVPYYKQGTSPDNLEKNFLGFVYAPFIFKNLMEGTLEETSRRVGITIQDENVLLYDEENHTEAPQKEVSSFSTTGTIDAYGRTWRYEVWDKESFQAAHNSSKPLFILLLGIIIDGFLIAIFIFFARANKAALKLAKEYSIEKEEALHFQNLILKNIPDIVFVKDSEFRIIQANAPLFNLYPEEMRDSILGTTTIEAYSPEEADEFVKNDRQALDKGYSEVTETLTFADGVTRTLYTKKVGFNNSAGDRFLIGIARDITLLIEKENDLEQANSELEEFAYRTSHDLRSPLLSSIGLLKIVKQFVEENKSQQAIEGIGLIDNSLVKLENLIQDILQLTHTKQFIEDDVSININQAVQDALTKFTHMDYFDRLDIELDLKLEQNIISKQSRIMLIIENLISNAIKYQDPIEEEPFIHIKTYTEGKNAVIEITDNGLGIPKDQQDKLFTMFKRFHPKISSGSGLGLYMMKKSADIVGGTLIFSDKNKGTSFKFSLPLD